MVCFVGRTGAQKHDYRSLVEAAVQYRRQVVDCGGTLLDIRKQEDRLRLAISRAVR